MNLHGLFNATTIHIKEQPWYYLTHSWEDIGFWYLPKGISPKVNIKWQLELEIAYFEAAIQHFSPYATETHPSG